MSISAASGCRARVVATSAALRRLTGMSPVVGALGRLSLAYSPKVRLSWCRDSAFAAHLHSRAHKVLRCCSHFPLCSCRNTHCGCFVALSIAGTEPVALRHICKVWQTRRIEHVLGICLGVHT